jgi:copper transport protein
MGASGAGAHALLSSSTPEDGAELTESPSAVVLSFTEEPEPTLAEVRVVDAAGAEVSTAPAAPAPARPKQLRVPVGDLADGVYTVTWRVVSRVDGHATAGAFGFGVGVAPQAANVPASVSEVAPPSPIEVGGRWLMFIGLGLLIGLAWVGALAFQRTPPALFVLGSWAWVVAVLGLVGLAAVQWQTAGGGAGRLLGTRIGTALLLRAAGIVVAGTALLIARRGRSASILPVAGVAAAGTFLAHVAAGHAGAAASPVLDVGAQWVHVVAGSVWLGGLAALLVGVRGARVEERSRAVRRFSTVAGVTLFVVAGTGVVRALGELSSWGDLFSSLYGRLVLVKGGLLVALAVLGAVNRYRNVPASGATMAGLSRVSRGELALGLAVLAAAGLLASVSPPFPQAQAAGRSGVVAVGSDFAGTTRIRLEASPGSAGSNRFTVQVTDPDTGAPIGADRVSLRFSYLGPDPVGSSTLDLAPSQGAFQAQGANLSLAGRWELVVLVQRGTDSVEIPLQLGTTCGAQPLPADQGPTLYTLELPSGSAQGYVDPGAAGDNEVHMTYFDGDGTEAEIGDDVGITASSGNDTMTLEPRRLGPGHFVAAATLLAGRWRFDVRASTTDRAPLPACFEHTIG